MRRCKTSSSSCEGTLSITSKAALARDTAERDEQPAVEMGMEARAPFTVVDHSMLHQHPGNTRFVALPDEGAAAVAGQHLLGE